MRRVGESRCRIPFDPGDPGEGYDAAVHTEAAYLFRHALLRDGAYQLQLPGERARMHSLAFEITEALAGGRAPATAWDEHTGWTIQPHSSDPLALELSEHAGLARDPAGPFDQTLREVECMYLRRAAEYALSRFRYEVAARLWERHAGLTSGAREAVSLHQAALAADAGTRTRGSEGLLRRALGIYRDLGLRRQEARVLGDLSNLQRETGLPGDAEQSLRLALRIARESGDRRLLGSILGSLATLCTDTSRTAEAEEAFAEALAIHREVGNRKHEGIVMGARAVLCLNTGRYEEAEALHESALAIHREVGDRRREGITLANLGNAYSRTGRYVEAERNYEAGLAIHHEVGDRMAVGVALGNLALLRQRQHELAAAEHLHVQALAVHREVGNRRSEGITLGNLAAIYEDTGRVNLVEPAYLESIALHRSAANPRFEGIHLCNYALHLLSVGRLEEGGARWRECARALRAIGDELTLRACAAELHEACARLGLPIPDDGRG